MVGLAAVLAIWFPTMAFVAIGYDQCTSNMYYGLLGLMLDVPGKGVPRKAMPNKQWPSDHVALCADFVCV